MRDSLEYMSPVARAAEGLPAVALRGVVAGQRGVEAQDWSPLLRAIVRALEGRSGKARAVREAEVPSVPGESVGGPERGRASQAVAAGASGAGGTGPAGQRAEPEGQVAESKLPGRWALEPVQETEAVAAADEQKAKKTVEEPRAGTGRALEHELAEAPRPGGGVAEGSGESGQAGSEGAPGISLLIEAALARPRQGLAEIAEETMPLPRRREDAAGAVVRSAGAQAVRVDVTVRTATDRLAAALAESDEVQEAIYRALALVCDPAGDGRGTYR